MAIAYGKNLLPSTVGFDRLLSTMEDFDRMFNVEGKVQKNTYPPYNIVKIDDNNYEIQIAVAGFSKEDIDIEIVQNKLTVIGSIPKDVEESVQYLYHGLSSRDFKHVFMLNDTIVVRNANILNGVLRISLENVIPEGKKSKKILISS